MMHIPQIIEAVCLSFAVGGGVVGALYRNGPFILPLTRFHQRCACGLMAGAAACEAINLALGGFWNV